MASRRGRRFSAVKRQMIWTAVQLDGAVLTSAGTAADIVAPADWTAIGGFEKGAVLQRIRGCVSVSTAVVTTLSARCWMMICKINGAETVPLPQAVGSYVLEDVLWQSNALFIQTAANAATIQPVQFDVDVKSKRRLDTNSLITFVIQGTGTAGALAANVLLRGLVAKP